MIKSEAYLSIAYREQPRLLRRGRGELYKIEKNLFGFIIYIHFFLYTQSYEGHHRYKSQ